LARFAAALSKSHVQRNIDPFVATNMALQPQLVKHWIALQAKNDHGY
jgi:hypothetical protein